MRRGRTRAWIAALAIALGGCATAPGRRSAPEGAAWDGWAQAIAGKTGPARTRFEAASRAAPADVVAWFGLGSVAFEQGDDPGALDAYLHVLEAAAADRTAWGPLVAAAAATRLPALLASVEERTAFEARLLRLPRAGLPWAAQVHVADAVDAVARRRGDGALLGAEPARAGCLGSVELLPPVGRLPHLDLVHEAPAPAAPSRRVSASGCRLLVPALEGHPAARALRAAIEVPEGRYDLVLDYPGPAAVRVDGGAWHRHDSAKVYGPRASAVRLPLAAGRHVVDLRIGSFGGASEVRVFLLRDPPPPAAPEAGEGDPAGAVAAFAALLVADGLGDVDRTLALVAQMERRRTFALGLAAAAGAVGRDPTRPSSLVRDAARALVRRALGTDDRLARSWRELALTDLERERANEAVEHAERAVASAPGWWPAAAVLVDAYRTRGLERDADRVLDGAVARALGRPGSACPILQAGYRRAQERNRTDEENRLAAALAACDAQAGVDLRVERARVRGDLGAAEEALRRALAAAADPDGVRAELAQLALAAGRPAESAAALAGLVTAAPRDPTLRLRLADALRAAGDEAGARRVVTDALRLHPSRPEVRQAARLLALPLPLDRYRVDGAAVIKTFAAANRRYDAPSVLVLDRTVTRVFDDGTQAILTHNIVRVQSKDGIERWGEVQVPEGADVLTLRTHKPDGTTREPEEIAGKPTISAPDLAVGDFIEWETLEYREPVDAHAPGFIGERFYFQSIEAPLDRSEYLLVLPPGRTVDVDRRAGAPEAVREEGEGGLQIVRFVAARMPQLFAERAAVAPIEWIPSVRVSSGASLGRWGRYLADQLHGLGRGSPALRQAAAALAARVGRDPARLGPALVRWVTDTIEPEEGLLEPATATLARGRGNRAALLVALARELGIEADVALVRSPLDVPVDAPISPQEVDDFGELLVRLALPGGVRYVDPRLRRAPFGYLPPGLDGALAYVVGPNRLERTRTSVEDRREVRLEVRIGVQGEGEGRATERLFGLPALEWTELLDRVGKDEAKLRQEFEQRWLNQHFPGAQLGKLAIELVERGEQGVRLSYGFSVPQLAVGAGGEHKLVPSFFRSQTGRRYATERARKTTLLVGIDVPLDLEAVFELPPHARVVDPGAGGRLTAGRRGEILFLERREATAQGAAPRVTIRRQVRLPLVRIPPAGYDEAAAVLRRIDPLEQGEIRFALPPARAGAAPGREGDRGSPGR